MRYTLTNRAAYDYPIQLLTRLGYCFRSQSDRWFDRPTAGNRCHLADHS